MIHVHIDSRDYNGRPDRIRLELDEELRPLVIEVLTHLGNYLKHGGGALEIASKTAQVSLGALEDALKKELQPQMIEKRDYNNVICALGKDGFVEVGRIEIPPTQDKPPEWKPVGNQP